MTELDNKINVGHGRLHFATKLHRRGRSAAPFHNKALKREYLPVSETAFLFGAVGNAVRNGEFTILYFKVGISLDCVDPYSPDDVLILAMRTAFRYSDQQLIWDCGKL